MAKFASSSFQLVLYSKMPGFHVTDYRKPEKKDGDGRKPEFSLPSDESSEKAETKPSLL